MTIIGVILSFRSLAQEALRDVSQSPHTSQPIPAHLFYPSCSSALTPSRPPQVLSCHIPFLVSSVEDFKDHIPRETDMKVGHTHTHISKNALSHICTHTRTRLVLTCVTSLSVCAGGHERVRAVVCGRSALRDRPRSGGGAVLPEVW